MRVLVLLTALAGTGAHSAVVQLGAYPELDNSIIPPKGTLHLWHVEGTNLLQVSGLMTGLEPSQTGGWHIHTGFKCVLDADESPGTVVGGHYFPGMTTDPWNAVKYTADAYGVAEVSLTIPDFSLTGLNPVLGRAVVVHNAAGARVGCGLIEPTTGEVVTLGTYPGYTGTSRVKGKIHVSTSAGGDLTFAGTLAGLPASGNGGWHIHVGSSCSATAAQVAATTPTAITGDGVGGHYWPDMATDPWNVITYQSDMYGVATIAASLPEFSLYETNPVVGRALVVHDPATLGSTRSGCGLVGSPQMGVVTMGSYPTNAGVVNNGPSGTLRVTYDEATHTLSLDGVLTGLTASRAGGWHVHEGFTCETGAQLQIGGHYYTTGEVDAWAPMSYVANADGVAIVAAKVAGFSLTGSMPVLGRAIVVHGQTGNRIGCGIIRPVNGEALTFGKYPGYTGTSTIHGLLVAQSLTGGGIQMSGTLAGLAPSGEGGWHIHAGYTCFEGYGFGTPGTPNDVIGGHYYPGMVVDPWNDIKYQSDTDGVATVSMNLTGFSLYETNPVAGRAVVIHDPTSPRAACGVIGSEFSGPQLAYASMGPYPGLISDFNGNPITLGGTLAMEYLPNGEMLRVRGVITGLNSSTTGGWHIHSGYSCDNAALVGGHYYTAGTADAWKGVTYTADSSGNAVISALVPGFSLANVNNLPVLGHALVVHNSFGTRIGCGIITPAFKGSTVQLGRYPSSSGNVGGLLVMRSLSATGPTGAAGGMMAGAGGLSVVGTLTGLPKSETGGGGWHVHSGYTCDDEDGVFGHYYEGMGANDPWNDIRYGPTDTKGVVHIDAPYIGGFSLSAARPVDLRSVVVHEPSGSRAGCGTLGADDEATTTTLAEGGGMMGGGMMLVVGGTNLVEQLQAFIEVNSADFIDVAILWMRTAHPALVAFGNAVFLVACVVLMLPGILLAIMVGYGWTYAYGGMMGVGLGTITFVLGTLVGCMFCYLLGTLACCKTCVNKCKVPGCVATLMEHLDGQPTKLIILLRISPFVPFNFLNYYVGASGRFTLKHVFIGHIFTIPLSFTWVGIGGAIVKFRMVQRGEIDEDTYLPFIWGGLGVTIALVLVQAGAVILWSKKTVKGIRSTTHPQQDVNLIAPVVEVKGDAYGSITSGGAPPPPPPPPPEAEDNLNLKPGWRPVVSDEGETYYFHDDSGESQWDPPLADDADGPPPPAPPPPIDDVPPPPRDSFAMAE